MSEPPARELTPDEIVADIEAMKPRKHKVTIYQSWPRMILERERARRGSGTDQRIAELEAAQDFLREQLHAAAGSEAGLDVERLARALGEAWPLSAPGALDEHARRIAAAYAAQADEAEKSDG